MWAGTVFLCMIGATAALYSSSDDVIQLTPANFQREVIQSNNLWLVEFYAPWCGHCKNLAPEWKKAASALKDFVKVGAVDADAYGQLGQQYGVTGFPTIKVFGTSKNSPTDYKGARSAQAIVDSMLSMAKTMVNDRLKGGKKSSGDGSKSSGSKKGNTDDVIELTDSNFESEVMKSEDMWLVEFFAPWCGHCKNLAPEWASAATQLKGKVKVAAVDATVHTVISGRHNVRGYPTIKYFPAGKKAPDSVEDYDGGRTASDIIRWAEGKLAENMPPPEIHQLTSGDVLADACDNHQLCVISFLPHILDCQSQCRNNFLSMLLKLGDKYKKRMWGWVWSEAASQMSLEESVGVGGFGYPAMVAVNSRKKIYSILKGSFSEEGINEFLRDLAFGKGTTAPLRGSELPKVEPSDPWDGKDGELPVEDDIDLSDVILDDLDDEKDEL